ncbi:MAG TPA: hypothetical protein VE030_11365 [Burkholderiales bacterium]|nr:hypothetical protein [Burkholderiales bacterium]
MRTIEVELTSEMPLLMHADNIDWADKMEDWKNDPKNKSKSKPGDDRTPAWRWLGCLNYDDPKTGVVTVPSEYIMRCLMGGAAEVPTGKGRKTFKELSQSGILCEKFHWPLLINGEKKPVRMEDINQLLKVPRFPDQVEGAKALGFSLFVKRARVGNNKHIRVRPRFDDWSTRGELMIIDDQITNDVVASILDISGRLKGLGDWRPSAKTPGPFGTFKAKIVS